MLEEIFMCDNSQVNAVTGDILRQVVEKPEQPHPSLIAQLSLLYVGLELDGRLLEEAHIVVVPNGYNTEYMRPN